MATIFKFMRCLGQVMVLGLLGWAAAAAAATVVVVVVAVATTGEGEVVGEEAEVTGGEAVVVVGVGLVVVTEAAAAAVPGVVVVLAAVAAVAVGKYASLSKIQEVANSVTGAITPTTQAALGVALLASSSFPNNLRGEELEELPAAVVAEKVNNLAVAVVVVEAMAAGEGEVVQVVSGVVEAVVKGVVGADGAAVEVSRYLLCDSCKLRQGSLWRFYVHETVVRLLLENAEE